MAGSSAEQSQGKGFGRRAAQQNRAKEKDMAEASAEMSLQMLPEPP